MVRPNAKEPLNAMLEAEAGQLSLAQRYEL